jgi:hypothetical protein
MSKARELPAFLAAHPGGASAEVRYQHGFSARSGNDAK